MSGRRRRNDGWDGGHRDAQDDRRDPWADSNVDEWGAADPDSGRYAAGLGYGGQRERGAASGHGATGYSNDGYQDPGYGRGSSGGSRRDAARPGAAPGGQRNGSGHGNGRPGGSAHAPEFAPAYNADLAADGPAGTPRPYGRLSIYTLHGDKTREFDRLAERAAEGVRAAEPDTLVYVIHVVPKAPMQRIIYEIYRDRAAFLTHERQPHIRQFTADSASCVLVTNIIDLRLKYAKVAALGPATEAPMPSQASRAPHPPERAAGSDRYQPAGGQYQASQHPPTQYSAAPQAGAATFTPAKDQYADNGQPTVNREAFRPGTQPGGTGKYGVANGQHGTGSANGGSYSGASGYANGNGYSAANRYSNGGSDQNGSGYPAPGGHGSNGAASNGLQYTPRYRELTSGRDPDGGQSNRPQPTEWTPGPQDQR